MFTNTWTKKLSHIRRHCILFELYHDIHTTAKICWLKFKSIQYFKFVSPSLCTTKKKIIGCTTMEAPSNMIQGSSSNCDSSCSCQRECLHHFIQNDDSSWRSQRWWCRHGRGNFKSHLTTFFVFLTRATRALFVGLHLLWRHDNWWELCLLVES